jgi:hypothetical protein
MSPSVQRLDHADATPVPVELHETINQREKRIVVADSDTPTRVVLSSSLANEDVSSSHLLATESLHAASLGVGVAAVPAGALSFLVCHLPILTYSTHFICSNRAISAPTGQHGAGNRRLGNISFYR